MSRTGPLLGQVDGLLDSVVEPLELVLGFGLVHYLAKWMACLTLLWSLWSLSCWAGRLLRQVYGQPDPVVEPLEHVPDWSTTWPG